MKDGTSNIYLNSAEHLKSRLIDFILKQGDDMLIGNEIMYGTKRKVVDLLIVRNNKLIAIEIKGNSDDLRRIQEQVGECRKIFDYVIVCTTDIHAEKIKEYISDDVGIYVIREKNVTKIRSSKKQKTQNKQEMLYTMNAKYLRNTLNIKAQLDSDELRTYISRKSLNKIHDLLCSYFSLKIENKYKLFLSDRGMETHIDDIPLLSSDIEIQ